VLLVVQAEYLPKLAHSLISPAPSLLPYLPPKYAGDEKPNSSFIKTQMEWNVSLIQLILLV